MKRVHIFGLVGFLTLVVILLGAIRSNSPVVQYLGNTTGVLLGFMLGVWWQETEKERIRKEHEAEKKKIQVEELERFWNEYKAFLLEFEIKVNYLKTQVGNIHDTIFEHRLPLPEAKYFERLAGELDIDKKTRQEIGFIADKTQAIDEYIDMGTEKLRHWHTTFGYRVDELWMRVREVNLKHSGKTAI